MGLSQMLDRLTGRTTRAVTPADFGHDRGWGGDDTATGKPVTLDRAMSLPVFARCVTLLVDDIAQLPVDVHRRAGSVRVELPPPSWLVAPSLDINETWTDHIAEVVFSLVTDRNAFIRCYPDRFTPEFLAVLDPSTVDVRTHPDGVTYRVREGRTSTDLDASTIVHIRAGRTAGHARAESRISMMRDTIALGLAAEEYGGRFFRDGATMSGLIKVPQGATVDAEKLQATMQRKHGGASKSHALGVLTGGADFQSLTVDAEKSQLLGLKEAVVEDVARGFGIPPYLVGSTKPGAVAYASTSNARVDYVVHAVVAIVKRLEDAYSGLVPGADTFMRWNLNALLRGDQEARFRAYQTGLASRFITRDEVRAWEDWGPADEALGVGTADGDYLSTPNNTPADPGIRDAVEAAGQLIRAGFLPGAALAAVGLEDMPHTGLLPVTLKDPGESAGSDRSLIVVPDVRIAPEAAAVLAERIDAQGRAFVDEVAAQGVDTAQQFERTTAAAREWAQAIRDDVARDLEAARLAQEETTARLLAIPSVVREVTARDDHGRPIGIVEQRGDRVIRKVVERDADGRIVKVTEVAA